ncbi:MAG: hypothetical protein PHZ19_09925 [Candidatus Thermoplasmatota archaeon]|nr:hypothetical protein [Candidatus Thermoplasmatota archaeon]
MPGGSKYELEIKERLENLGWLVVRSAGSMGAADIVAMKPSDRGVLLAIIEGKSLHGDTFYVSSTAKNIDQWEAYKMLIEWGFPCVVYVIRWKSPPLMEFFDLAECDPDRMPIFRRGTGYSLERLERLAGKKGG